MQHEHSAVESQCSIVQTLLFTCFDTMFRNVVIAADELWLASQLPHSPAAVQRMLSVQ
jgi:hypothetical protein